ncbi:MAG: hemerythrin domain-containing protein [Candidatus Scalindua sp.]|nr:hemerythrin domain-containing protein [Candidatus Scalindua sp.]MCR4344208.1 hemerythrin domain-containing protein [Candidatus Scalindua sp.]
MGATIDSFKATHQAAAGLLGQIDSQSGQERANTLNGLKEALLAHVGEENKIITEAIGKSDDESFKSAAQSFIDELGKIAETALLPFFNKYSSADAVDSDGFANDFGGIKDALSNRIVFEEEKFYPELEKQGY